MALFECRILTFHNTSIAIGENQKLVFLWAFSDQYEYLEFGFVHSKNGKGHKNSKAFQFILKMNLRLYQYHSYSNSTILFIFSLRKNRSILDFQFLGLESTAASAITVSFGDEIKGHHYLF